MRGTGRTRNYVLLRSDTKFCRSEAYDSATGAASRTPQFLGGVAGTVKVVVPALASERKKNTANSNIVCSLWSNIKLETKRTKGEVSYLLAFIQTFHFFLGKKKWTWGELTPQCE
jgi:hypothetical protein